jgi:hypothetical protein
LISQQPYQTLDHALKHGLRVQVSESIGYVLDTFPPLSSPEAVFNFLKQRTRYKKDPKGRELFQTVETLLNDNWHGITGAGDCDCFTIAALATLLANGFTDSGIVLAGRNPITPVHIWAYTDIDGRRYDLDLTNRTYNTTRFYRYTQHIPYKLNAKEKAMILELAEGGARRRRKKGKVYVSSYVRRYPALNEGASPLGYIWLPESRIQVREDYYDGMSCGEFQQLCLSEGVPLEELEELSGNRAKRRLENKKLKMEVKAMKPKNVRKAAKQEAKAVRKQTNADTRLIKQEGKSALRTSRGQAKVLRGDAKVIRSQNPNRGENFRKFTQAMFTPKAQPAPEVVDAEYVEVEPEVNPAQIDWPEPDAYIDPSQEIMPAQPELIYQEEYQQEQEPEYQMAEGFSINRKQALTGTLLFVAGAALAKYGSRLFR